MWLLRKKVQRLLKAEKEDSKKVIKKAGIKKSPLKITETDGADALKKWLSFLRRVLIFIDLLWYGNLLQGIAAASFHVLPVCYGGYALLFSLDFLQLTHTYLTLCS